MIVHIKSVNTNYDITNVFLYLSEKYQKKGVKMSSKKNYINNNTQKDNEILLNEEKNDNVDININNINNYEWDDIKLGNINMNLINNFVAYSYINVVLINNINEQFQNILILISYINSYYKEVSLVNINKDANNQ